MLRLSLFTMCALLAAVPASAEKFRDADLKALVPQIRATCLKPSDRQSWMTARQQESVCGCVAGKMHASLRKASFVNTRAPTAADKKKYMAFQDAAQLACTQPVFRQQTLRKVRQECVAKAPGIPVMQGLKRQRLDKVCGCVSERYARTWTLELVAKYPDTRSTMEGSRGLFAESIALCNAPPARKTPARKN
ncbi:hypothetical protein KY495_15500 [Massilia sp. PAMC28688]|uniref:hypothetical protein n=1 Tax=Massilia sp. PAMC28688 TaxID=2861283 RepID=UPI001C638D0A|nr:hypothetical protein [Massilia sp. PAMC28688]QYF92163.1 hypothetical protein KY495_15500 [Massilia sp. PAMC28688]